MIFTKSFPNNPQLTRVVRNSQVLYEIQILQDGLSMENHFLCLKCHSFHHSTSLVGKRHTKYQLLSSVWKEKFGAEKLVTFHYEDIIDVATEAELNA